MDRPLAVERYIKLITKEALDTDVIKQWYQCVKKNAPAGTTRSVNMIDGSTPRSVALVHQETENRHSYMVPLTRDLFDDEVDDIVNCFVDTELVDNFNVETNDTKLLAKDHAGIKLDAAKHLALCHALAKQKHEDWVRERTKSGWRYGTSFDVEDKTHPLLRPWDQIPDRFKEPDMDWPQKLVTMLNDQGYAVIERNELEKLMALLRGAV